MDSLDQLDHFNHFEYERRFFCESIPSEILANESPTLIVQNYYVHQDNYALRVRLNAKNVRLDMTEDTDPISVLARYRDSFTEATLTAKGPAVGGTRYELENSIDPDVAAELVFRGGKAIIKNRYSIWQGEDGWKIDLFGADNYPLIVAEVERHNPVTNLVIPSFCTTEITDQARFSNDGLAGKPFSAWKDSFASELEEVGPLFLDSFGENRREEE
ncbi:hypothetical protein B9G54_04045 [Alloscardovia macacae]|uniref:CYTH domain-containing protein n=1 Tax=Alloscardovia macacae TaxID=1160091 RepID=A0A1Y2SUL9_9BIFI|nr:hypothetical protein [Alloscardovia macacae]OTA26567.1 hypothetical protein B9G54_04045 [Alloscardovia macacae]OTA29044.1 hypothetical protein B9T39_05155 [Alloscardovia macacae]